MTKSLGMIGSRGIFGIVLVALGALFLVSNYYRGFYWEDYWPLMFVIWGGARFAAFGARRWGLSVSLIALGLFLFVREYPGFYFLDDIGWNTIWPVALILLGVFMVVRNLNSHAESSANAKDKDTLSSFSILGGNNAKIVSKNFRGGTALAFLGGVEIDMREAELSSEVDTIKIDATAVLGGVEIYAPITWAVKTKGIPILGSIEDQRPNPPQVDGAQKTLIVDGLAFLGSIEIRA